MVGKSTGKPVLFSISKGVVMKKKIDWDLIQAIILVGMMPAMIGFGAIFPGLFATYR